MKCDYCQSTCAVDDLKCGNCGAPVSHADAPTPDYRFCPYCKRRLLALGSPACNYCGRHLPADFVKAREALLQRIEAVSAAEATEEEREQLAGEGDDALRRALKSVFDLERRKPGR